MKYTFENLKDFDLKQILDCGQCFRWKENPDGSWVGIVNGQIATMSFDGNNLEIEADNTPKNDAGKEFWYNYLDLSRDYGKIKKELSEKDQVLKVAIKSGEGIRILNQDLWEVLVSFIISQNNNIPRIKGCIEKLSAILGEPLGEIDGKTVYSFPTVECLAKATLEEISPVKLGYRAPYLIETAKNVLEEGCFREDLRTYLGVGPKVESCINLFGRHNMKAFPIDVWVKRVMNRMYGIPEKNVKEMQRYSEEHFGEYGGIAQQYLFYYIRTLDQTEA